ncbi:MAG: alpha/beta hydrolase fold domain-containing protein [Saccharolobus sp.]
MLVYFNGGGFVLGDPICRDITNACNCVVVFVDYRLTPYYKRSLHLLHQKTF